jgi:hypothetical protein
MMILYFSDCSDEKLNDMLDYCRDNSLSLAMFRNDDVSDVSGRWDTIASFQFDKEDDAMIFKLKYASN